jgi:oligopeptide/dipeptide ABC transporter ATP-binding protein
MPSTLASPDSRAPAGAVLQLSDLSVSFPTTRGGLHAAARGVTLSVARGECLGVVGESGAGKSVVFLALMGLLPASARITGSARFGATELLGAPVRQLDELRGAAIGMIFQDPMTSLTPHLGVGAQIAEVLERHRGMGRVAARARALELLERVHIGDAPRRFRQFPHELSGGMRQRVMIAIAIACEPQLLIADEPTTALDVTIQAQILALLAELKREQGMAMVLITHDLGAVAGLADRVAVMRSGELVESGPVATVLRSPRAPYTQELLRNAPRLQSPALTAAPAVGTSALTLEGVSVQYALRSGWLTQAARFTALHPVSVALGSGAALGVVGESGAGKSTLSRAILQLVRPSSGRVVWMGTTLGELGAARLRALRRELQIIFQDPLGSLDPRMTVGEIIGEPLRVHAPLLSRSERASKVSTALARVALDAGLRARYPHELSGGQCQRVGIARAMVLEPRLLVCDEPVSALDAPTQQQIVALLGALRRDTAMSLIFVSHNLALVQQLCDRVLVLYLGRMMELADSAALFTRPLHPYTRELLESVPIPDPDLQPARLARARPGEAPSPLHPPRGCVYRSRCPYAVPVCAERLPEWEDAGAGRRVACHRWRELP